jgi:hypothetical protein
MSVEIYLKSNYSEEKLGRALDDSHDMTKHKKTGILNQQEDSGLYYTDLFYYLIGKLPNPDIAVSHRIAVVLQ